VAIAPGGYTVTAMANGFVTASARGGQPIVVDGTRPTEVDLVLQPGGSRVTGVAMDATGGLVPHATVFGERADGIRTGIFVECDDLGRFSLWLPAGPIALSASAEAYAPARWVGVAPSSGVRLVMTPGAAVRGVVVSALDGAPVAGVEVRALPIQHRSSAIFQSSVSADDGAFDVKGLVPGSYALAATGVGWHGEYPTPVSLDLGAMVDKVVIQVHPAAQVTGHVVLADTQQPCQAGAVKLGGPDGLQPPDSDVSQTLPAAWKGTELRVGIEADGVVRFPAVPAGTYYVSVRCLENVLREGPRVLHVGAGSPLEVTWKVGAGSSLSVLVSDERDRPVPSAKVSIQFPKWSNSWPQVITGGVADQRGRYDLPGILHPGTYEIASEAPWEAAPIRADLREGDRAEVKLIIPGSASLTTTVRSRDGSTLDGLSVTAIAMDAPRGADAGGEPKLFGRSRFAFSATALGDGRYRIMPLKPGRYELRVEDGVNAAVNAGTYRLSAGDSIDTSVELTRDASIHGHVVGDDGIPVPNVWISVESETGDARAETNTTSAGVSLATFKTVSGAGAARVLTEPDGRFVIDHLSGDDQEYTLRAEQPGGAVALKSDVKAGSAEVTIRLPAAGALEGALVGACGDVLTPAMIRAMNTETGQITSQMAAGDGSFLLRGVTPGHVEITAFCRGGGDRVATVSIELAPGQHATGLSLSLRPSPLAQGNSSPSSAPP
jgi:hypothetical protein